MARWNSFFFFSLFVKLCLSLLVFLCLVLACIVSKICLGDSSDMEDMKDLRLTVVLEDLVSLHTCVRDWQ